MIRTSSRAVTAIVMAAALAGMPVAARAKTVSLGSDPAVATIAIPDAWKSDVTEGQVEALSPDQTLYLSAEVVPAEDLQATGREVARVLAEEKIDLKQDSRKVAQVTFAGMPGAAISWDATDADGPTQVHMVVIKAKPDFEVLVLRWGNEAAEKYHAADIEGILKSLAPAK